MAFDDDAGNTALFREFVAFLQDPPRNFEEGEKHIGLFHQFLLERCLYVYEKYQLEPLLCGISVAGSDNINHNIEAVYESFIHDVGRMMEDSLPCGSGKPDHFKLAGILAYWLRRYPPAYSFELKSPLSDMHDDFARKEIINILVKDIPETPENMEEIRKKCFPWYIMFRYHQAYFAFDTGLSICDYFERESGGTEEGALTIKLSKDFLHMVCHFIKYKNVSPHGLIMIYQALYQRSQYESQSLLTTP